MLNLYLFLFSTKSFEFHNLQDMQQVEYSKSKLDSFIKNPKKALWKMTLPFFLGLSVQSLYMLMDVMFVGKFLSRDGYNVCELQQLSQSAIDAMGVIFPLMFIIMGLTFGLGSGTTTLIAQYIGAKNKESADSVASHTILIGILLPAIIIAIVFLLGDSIIEVQLKNNTNPDTLKYAQEYFKIMALGSVFMVLAIFFRSILSGEGETVLPMKILGFGTILNIILDPIFIIVFKLEVAGAAIATVISNGTVALSFIYFLIIKKKSYTNISFKKDVFKFDFQIIRSLFRLGIPASASFAIMSIGMLANNSILSMADYNTYGEVQKYAEPGWAKDCPEIEKEGGVVGGYQISARIENLFMNLVIAVSSSMVTIVGMFYGAGRPDLIRPVINYALKWGTIFSLIATFIFFFFSNYIIHGFTNDPKTIDEAIKYFNICAFTYPFVAIGMITCRAMQGMDKPTPFLFLTLLRVILIAIPMAWIGVKYFEYGTNWVWWSVLISSIVAAIFSLLWMYRIIYYRERINLN